ncbi:hypothetical protein AGRO_3193 [Agrobacterium sp. ATCC 31749]|uniref:hypothetical protein n=1 Tax=Agrobacterium TaxID=357 RepID=UPI00020DBAA5|nr:MULTISPECIES: hypothetical protein [Agrobacterium]EGL64144.1 hypothetical protein AGRO_3193 [Agrobacterium sp. ATCC 31749]MCR6727200.1 hypothetical protein [Agrobacterium fabrum]QKX00330.1 hypothetical protein GSF67_24500 [Agrobacterium sp. CGMCC 11546]CAH0267810.1 hypothetical protein SRABI46_03660 [Agrobacterium fabrum]CAH0281754.1 hypothetical protein SRABI05_03812 [Agrobacterium fabrum]
MPRSKLKLVSLTPLFAALAASPLVQQTVAVTAIVSLSMGQAVAGSPVRMNAQALLGDMRRSLAEIAFSFSEAKGDSKRRSGVAVLAALTEATRAVQSLETAIAAHDASRISRATKALSHAVGNLQTRYSLSSAKCDAVTRALQRFNAAWAEYSSRFVLAKHKASAANATASDVQALRRKVADLSYRMQQLEDDVADNAALRGEVIRMRREIAITQSTPANAYDYQRLSFTLTVLSGSFAALSLTTREYYPSYYVSVAPFESYRSIDTYWDGYYDGYYQGVADSYYSEPMVISSPVMTESRTETYQNVTYETIYSVTNETTNIYQTMPEEDLSNVAVVPIPQGVNFSVEDISANQKSGSPEVDEFSNTGLPASEAASGTMPEVLPESNSTDQAPDVPDDQDEPPPAIPSPLDHHSNDGNAGTFDDTAGSVSPDHDDKPWAPEDRLSRDHSTPDTLPSNESTGEPRAAMRVPEDEASGEEPVMKATP